MTRNRKTVVCNAAREIVRTIEGLNLRCILIEEMAAFLHGAPTVPTDVKAIVVAPLPGTRLKNNIAMALVQTNPLKFRVRTNKTKSDPATIAYFDPTVASQKKDCCNLQLITVPNPPPPEFQPSCIIRVGGLPVLPLLPVLVQILHDLLVHYDSVKTEDGRLLWKPPKRVQKNIKKLSTQPFSGNDSANIPDELFQKGALTLFKRAQAISPELSPHIAAFIRRCQMKGYLPSPDDSPITEIKTFGFVVDGDPQEPANDTTASSTTIANHRGFEATRSEVISPIHPNSPPLQLNAHILSRTEAVCHIAKQVVDILHRIGVDCAVFGSLGCYLYGNDRSPNDIDLVAFPRPTISITDEELKRAVVHLDPKNFCLDLPKDPKATFRILYFIVDSKLTHPDTFHKNKCKIDILFPGTLHLPSLPTHEIKWRHGLPVIPFPLLLLQKLQGWDDHRKMSEYHKYEKQFTDAVDVQSLLKLEHVVALRFSRPWSDRRLFSYEFQGLSLRRVQEFSREYPTSTNEWVLLGLHA